MFAKIIILFFIAVYSNKNAYSQTFTAYDCSKTRNHRLVPYEQKEPCLDVSGNMHIRQQHATILQDDGIERRKALKCTVRETRLVFVCGVWSHSVPVLYLTHDNVKKPISFVDCLTAHDQGHFKTESNLLMEVQQEGMTRINFDLAGRSYIEKGYAYCEGEEYRYQKTETESGVLYDAMVNIKLEVTLEKVHLTFRDNTTFDENGRRILPCPSEKQYCDLDGEMYIWPHYNTSCTTAMGQQFDGTIFHDNGKEAILSTDGSMIILDLKDSTYKCGYEVKSTQFNDIFVLLNDPSNSTVDQVFNRTLNMDLYELKEFVADRDRFIVEQLQKFVRFEQAKAAQRQCIWDDEFRRRLPLRNSPAQAPQETWRIGGATFAHHAGEAYYVFECAKVTVRPRNMDSCFMELPVMDNFHLTTELFLDVDTRQLSNFGTPIQCPQFMYKVIQADDGTWYRLTPHPSATLAPSPIKPHLHHLRVNSSTKGGLFSDREVKEALDKINRDKFERGVTRHLSDNIYDEVAHHVTERKEGWVKVLDKIKNFGSSIAHPFIHWFTESWMILKIILSVAAVVIPIAVVLYCCVQCGGLRMIRYCCCTCTAFLQRSRQPEPEPRREPAIQSIQETSFTRRPIVTMPAEEPIQQNLRALPPPSGIPRLPALPWAGQERG